MLHRPTDRPTTDRRTDRRQTDTITSMHVCLPRFPKPIPGEAGNRGPAPTPPRDPNQPRSEGLPPGPSPAGGGRRRRGGGLIEHELLMTQETWMYQMYSYIGDGIG